MLALRRQRCASWQDFNRLLPPLHTFSEQAHYFVPWFSWQRTQRRPPPRIQTYFPSNSSSPSTLRSLHREPPLSTKIPALMWRRECRGEPKRGRTSFFI